MKKIFALIFVFVFAILCSCSSITNYAQGTKVYKYNDTLYYFENEENNIGNDTLVAWNGGKDKKYIRTIEDSHFTALYGDKSYLYYAYPIYLSDSDTIVVERCNLENTNEKVEIFSISNEDSLDSGNYHSIYVNDSHVYLYANHSLFDYNEGTTEKILDGIEDVFITENNIYYSTRKEIFRMQLDTKTTELLLNYNDILSLDYDHRAEIIAGDSGTFRGIQFYDNKLYFLYSSYSQSFPQGILYEYDIEDQSIKFPIPDPVSIRTFYINNDGIYFQGRVSNLLNKASIFKYDFNGEIKLLVDSGISNVCSDISIINNKLYYYSYIENKGLLLQQLDIK